MYDIYKLGSKWVYDAPWLLRDDELRFVRVVSLRLVFEEGDEWVEVTVQTEGGALITAPGPVLKGFYKQD